MDTNSNEQRKPGEGSRAASPEQRLNELGIKLPASPEPFGIYNPVELELIFEVPA